MKSIRVIVVLAAVATIKISVYGQIAQLQYVNPTLSIESPAEEIFWERFKSEFTGNAEDLFDDRFRPLRMIRGTAEEQSDPFREMSARSSRNNFCRAAGNGLREAAVDLPIMDWLHDKQGFLADFLRNSVGNVEEETVEPLNLSYLTAEQSWWRQSAREHLSYGIRPFRTDPYAFLSLGFRQGETLLALANLRYHYRGFADHRFELAVSIPLANGFSVQLGASYQFGQHTAETKVALKAFKEFVSGSLLFVGMEVRQSPGMTAGLTIPF